MPATDLPAPNLLDGDLLWHVLAVRSGAEDLAARYVLRWIEGAQVFLPMRTLIPCVTKRRQRSKKRVVVFGEPEIVPCWPGYLFATLPDGWSRRQLTRCTSIIDVLRGADEEPHTISASDLAAIASEAQRGTYNDVATGAPVRDIDLAAALIGRTVKLTDGPFLGYAATVAGVWEAGVDVEVLLFGRATPIRLPLPVFLAHGLPAIVPGSN